MQLQDTSLTTSLNTCHKRLRGHLTGGANRAVTICLSNNAAERALRGFALGRKAWLFAGSDRGADRAAFMATLIMTAKLNDIDPQAWLADVLARIADTPITKLEQLLPWNWSALGAIAEKAA
ncbi:IS66 family insertion sequence transposase domain-containing protein (plasmid) [Rhizobium gallicum]|uniref:IS66 family insertion sequence transposase domain-containing protein n=1 Tax=Rhizobium gallicum TaxID=56730 RepID=A0A1L5NWD9_9HYPH|nr:IS66 family insertion sequence transposase domain-containing protein [Rhizobium gallicum]